MIAFCVCVCRQACAAPWHAPWVALRDQRRVARQRRDALRSLLLNAARLGALPFGETRVADFAESGSVRGAPIFIDLVLDEDLQGDVGR